MRKSFIPLLLLAAPTWAANLDGTLDTSYGNAGRSFFEFTSSTPQLQALAKSPTGRIWLFGDDANDRGGLYLARMSASGVADAGFGNAGRLRTPVPVTLIAQTEALAVRGALVQTDGKPIVFGGLRAVNGETGAAVRIPESGSAPFFGTSALPVDSSSTWKSDSDPRACFNGECGVGRRTPQTRAFTRTRWQTALRATAPG